MLKLNILDPSNQRYIEENYNLLHIEFISITVVYFKNKLPEGICEWNPFKTTAVKSSAKKFRVTYCIMKGEVFRRANSSIIFFSFGFYFLIQEKFLD